MIELHNLSGSTIAFIIVISIALSIAVSYIVCRWIFGVNKHLKYQKHQIRLLLEIAKKNNGDAAIIKDIEADIRQ